jgi:RNA polymerase sigma factor (sigma-70 family)
MDSNYKSTSGDSDSGAPDGDEPDYQKGNYPPQSHIDWDKLDAAVHVMRDVGNRASEELEKAIADFFGICEYPVQRVIWRKLINSRCPKGEISGYVREVAADHLNNFVVFDLMGTNTEFEYQGPHQLISWLCNGAGYAALHFREKVCSSRLESLDTHIEQRDEPVVEDEEMSKVESERVPVIALMEKAKLSVREKKVILLTYFDKLKATQIADIIHTTPARVRNIRFRALQKMRRFINRNGYGEWRISGL